MVLCQLANVDSTGLSFVYVPYMQVMKNCITVLDAVSQWDSSVLSNMSSRYAIAGSNNYYFIITCMLFHLHALIIIIIYYNIIVCLLLCTIILLVSFQPNVVLWWLLKE